MEDKHLHVDGNPEHMSCAHTPRSRSRPWELRGRSRQLLSEKTSNLQEQSASPFEFSLTKEFEESTTHQERGVNICKKKIT